MNVLLLLSTSYYNFVFLKFCFSAYYNEYDYWMLARFSLFFNWCRNYQTCLIILALSHSEWTKKDAVGCNVIINLIWKIRCKISALVLLLLPVFILNAQNSIIADSGNQCHNIPCMWRNNGCESTCKSIFCARQKLVRIWWTIWKVCNRTYQLQACLAWTECRHEYAVNHQISFWKDNLFW